MRKLMMGTVVGMGLLFAAGGAAAQGTLPLSIEARGGLALPTGDFGDVVNTGYQLGVTARYAVVPMLSIYAGYEYASFDAEGDADLEEVDASVSDSGFRVGGQLGLPLSTVSGFSPYVQAGAIFNKAEFKLAGESGGSLNFETDRSVGFEVGAGAAVRLGPTLSLTPEVRYRSYDPKVEESEGDAGTLSYLTLGLGFTFHF